MTARRLVLRAVGAAAVASGVLLVATGPASADNAASVESGWWNEAAAGPVSAPTTASSGQLQVSSGLQGPLSFAAVRIGIPADLDPGTTSMTLTLVQVANSAVGTTAVSACPTTGSWKPGGGQPAGSAPGYDCTRGRQADATDSDGQDTFKIPAGWASGSTVDVAIVPTPGTTAPFSVQYTDPTDQSVVVSGASSAPTASTDPTGTAPAEAPAPPPGSGSDPSSAGPPASSAPVSFVPSGGGAAAAPAGVPSSATPPADSPAAPSLAAGGAASTPAPASSSPGGGEGYQASGAPAAASQSALPITSVPAAGPGRTGRVVAVSVLLLLGVVMFGLSGYPGRRPRALLPVGVNREATAPAPDPGSLGGIGRFAKPRTGPPRRL